MARKNPDKTKAVEIPRDAANLILVMERFPYGTKVRWVSTSALAATSWSGTVTGVRIHHGKIEVVVRWDAGHSGVAEQNVDADAIERAPITLAEVFAIEEPCASCGTTDAHPREGCAIYRTLDPGPDDGWPADEAKDTSHD